MAFFGQGFGITVVVVLCVQIQSPENICPVKYRKTGYLQICKVGVLNFCMHFDFFKYVFNEKEYVNCFFPALSSP